LKKAEVCSAVDHIFTKVISILFLFYDLQAEFAIGQSLMGNKANAVLNERCWVLSQNQKDVSVVGSKRTYPIEEPTQSPPQNEVGYNLILAVIPRFFFFCSSNYSFFFVIVF
jgi:hypothetical protein